MGVNLFKMLQQAGTQADRTDDVHVQSTGDETSTSENGESEGLGEDDDDAESTDV
jgi:hypothetical protein